MITEKSGGRGEKGVTSNFNLILNDIIFANATRDGDSVGIDIDFDQVDLAYENGSVDHDAAFNSVFAHELFTIRDFVLYSNRHTDNGLGPTRIVAYFHLIQGMR